MKRSTNDIRPPLDDLQREVGEALARARGRDPQSFFHGLPIWYSMLPLALAALFARDEALRTEIAAHHGMTLDEWRDSFLDLFEPMSTLTRCFRCTECGATDRTVWNKRGYSALGRRVEGEVFEGVCGEVCHGEDGQTDFHRFTRSKASFRRGDLVLATLCSRSSGLHAKLVNNPG